MSPTIRVHDETARGNIALMYDDLRKWLSEHRLDVSMGVIGGLIITGFIVSDALLGDYLTS